MCSPPVAGPIGWLCFAVGCAKPDIRPRRLQLPGHLRRAADAASGCCVDGVEGREMSDTTLVDGTGQEELHGSHGLLIRATGWTDQKAQAQKIQVESQSGILTYLFFLWATKRTREPMDSLESP